MIAKPTNTINVLIITSLVLNISYLGLKIYAMSKEGHNKKGTCGCQDKQET